MVQQTVVLTERVPESQTRRRGALSATLRALARRKLAMLGLAYILLFYAAAFSAPLIAPYSPRAQNLGVALQGPSRAHLLGTDRLGRDMLTRVIYAARTTAIITVLTAVTGGLVVGPLLGLLAGYLRGPVDAVINRVGEVVASLPDLMILIMLTATTRERLNNWVANYYDVPVIGQMLREGFASILVLYLVLTVIGWVGSMRFIRAQTLQLRQTDYVLAARSIGAGTGRVIGRHILPNLSHLLVLGLASSFGAIALSEIGLSFLGLGVRPPTATFGEMILAGSGVRNVERNPHLLFVPAFFAVMLLLSFNLLGDALNDVLNPRTREP